MHPDLQPACTCNDRGFTVAITKRGRDLLFGFCFCFFNATMGAPSFALVQLGESDRNQERSHAGTSLVSSG